MAHIIPSRLRKSEVEYELQARGARVEPGDDKATLDKQLKQFLLEGKEILPLAPEDVQEAEERARILAFIADTRAIFEEGGLSTDQVSRLQQRAHHWLRRLNRVASVAEEKKAFDELKGQINQLIYGDSQISTNQSVSPTKVSNVNVSQMPTTTVTIKPIEIDSPFKNFFKGIPPLTVSTPDQVFDLLLVMVKLEGLAQGFSVPDGALLKVLYPHTQGQLAQFLVECMSRVISWKKLRSDIINKFLPQSTKIRLIAEHYHRGQRDDETLLDYTNSLVNVCKALDIGDSEAKIVANVGIGANLPEVRSLFLRSNAPTSLEEMEYISIQLNASNATKQCESKQQVASPRTQNKPCNYNNNSHKFSQPPQMQRPSSGSLQSNRPYRVVCWNCNRPNHRWDQCPEPRKRVGPNSDKSRPQR